MSNAVTQLAKIIKNKLVRTVGGQKPDSDGNINMEGYALKKDVDDKISNKLSYIPRIAIPTTDNPTAFIDLLKSTTTPVGMSMVRDEHPNVTTSGATSQPLDSWVYKENQKYLFIYVYGLDQQGTLWTLTVISGVSSGWKRVPNLADVTALNNKITDIQARISGGATT